MRGSSYRLLALLLFVPAVLVSSCAPAATQLVVVVDTDLSVPGQLDRIEVGVSFEGVMVESESTPTLGDRDALPLTLSVIPEDAMRLGPVLVEAIGYRAGTAVVSRVAEVRLVAGETRALSLFLLAQCRGVTCPRGDETCGEDGCASRRVEDLPPWTGTPPSIGMDAGAPDAARDAARDAPIATTCGEDDDCDDGADCTTDRCNTSGMCEHVGSDVACDDDDPCTGDSCAVGGCVHAPLDGVSCDDGAFCNGLDTCEDGACTGHGGDPCVGGTCVEADDLCDIPCGGRDDCPADTFGAWTDCDYGDPCDEGAPRSRTARRWACTGGECVASDEPETEPCARDTEGMTCGGGSCGAWGACGGFAEACDESGTQTRSCTDSACTAGACGAVVRTESQACSRSTAGTSCGATSCGGWSACGGFTDTCDESGTQTRSCIDYACTAGGCAGTMRSESQACSRSTAGTSCGATSCDGWGACGGFADTCDESGTQSRTCTDRVCGGGTCGAPTRTESQGCGRSTGGVSCGTTSCTGWSTCAYSSECDETGAQSRTCTDRVCGGGTCGAPTRTESQDCGIRDTDSMSCGDDFDCTVERCSAGTCRYVSGGCSAGRTCCDNACYQICP